MNVIELTRQLGEAIQQDEKYIAFTEARRANEEDMELNAMIGKLNLVQMSYENMKRYEEKKQELDDMMNYLIGILSQCVNGADPATCEPVSEDGACTGSCSTCGGCS